jgi:hypothetical protein
MSFMYLHIEVDDQDGDILATVKNHGSIPRCSLGSGYSRWGGPIMVIKIDKFEGLDCITSNDLWEVLQTRKDLYPNLVAKFLQECVMEELLNEIRRRT